MKRKARIPGLGAIHRTIFTSAFRFFSLDGYLEKVGLRDQIRQIFYFGLALQDN